MQSDVADSETAARRGAQAAAIAVAVAMIAQQVASKAARDALFLTHFPATSLPSVMIGGAAISLVVVLVLSRSMSRLSPARVVPVAFGASALLFAAEWALAEAYPRQVAVAVYVHTAGVGAAVVSSFWSVVNERFDPHSAKRIIGKIAAGATVGGVIGGVAAWQAASYVSLPAMLLGLAIVNLVCAVGVTRIGAPANRVQRRDRQSGIAIMRQVPYLRHLAALIFIGTVGEAVIDYVFKVRAAGAYSSSEDLVMFFALFHMGVGVLTFVVQTSIVPRALRGLGLAGTVTTQPAVMVTGGVLALVFPQLWSAIVLRGGRAIVESSLFRSAYELLYTPLTPEKKRPTKTFIDVGCDRIGTAVGSGLALAAVALAPGSSESLLLGIGIGTAVIAVGLASLLHRGYIDALADSLVSGAIELGDSAKLDATTRRTLSDTTMALDRDKLLREIEALRQSKLDAGELPAAASSVGMPARAELPSDDQLLFAIAELRSGDAARIRNVLSRRPIRLELVAHAIPLLARDEVLEVTVRGLRSVADRCSGQLLDALLDPDSAFAVRRRLPRVLVGASKQSVVDGLLCGLEDQRFEVRYRCGVALLRLKLERPSLRFSRRQVLEAAKREAANTDGVWNSQALLDAADDEPGLFTPSDARQIGRSLEHVFTVLSLVLDREPLQLAYRALSNENESLRGTGLEYLENVLPQEIRHALLPYLGNRKVAARVSRPHRQVLDELLTSMDSSGIDVEALRKAMQSSSE